MPLGDRRQTTSAVLMVRPCRFGSNPETAASNRFQQSLAAAPEAIAEAARREFDDCVSTLTAAGVTTVVLDEPADQPLPDAIFPNNWLSTHEDGTLILYPLASALRRLERRVPTVIAALDHRGFDLRRVLDLTELEAEHRFLEGTGSLVLDRPDGAAYAALSSRTHRDALAGFAARTGYRVTSFDAHDAAGHAIYHTNVLMALGRSIAVVCLESVRAPGQRRQLEEALQRSGRSVLPISLAQLGQFAGNVLELENPQGEAVTVISRRAWESLTNVQRSRIESTSRPVVVAVDTIETVGGGSIRCMLAEIFLPLRG